MSRRRANGKKKPGAKRQDRAAVRRSKGLVSPQAPGGHEEVEFALEAKETSAVGLSDGDDQLLEEVAGQLVPSESALALPVETPVQESTDVDWRELTNGVVQDVLMDYLIDPSGARSADTVAIFLESHVGLSDELEAQIVDFFEEPRSIDDLESSALVSNMVRRFIMMARSLDTDEMLADTESHDSPDDSSVLSAQEGLEAPESQDTLTSALGGSQGAQGGMFEGTGAREGADRALNEEEEEDQGAVAPFVEPAYVQWAVVLPYDDNGILRNGNDFIINPPSLFLFDDKGEEELAELALNEKTARALLRSLEEVVSLYDEEEAPRWSFREFWEGIIQKHRDSKVLRVVTISLLSVSVFLGVYGTGVIAGWF